MVKGFEFKLEKILDIRRKNEEESARIFKKAEAEKEEIRDSLEELKNSYTKYNSVSNNETVAYQKIKRIYIQNITKAIEKTKKDLFLKENEVEKKRINLKNKQLERKTVERLREKQYEKFIKEQERVEKIENDEIALFGHFRKLERG